MDTNQAREIAGSAARLMELTTIFQLKYGRDYMMKPGSPTEAWELYQAIFDEQCHIACLLDVDTLEHPFIRYGKWWERRDVIDSGLLSELAHEAFNLISYSACHEHATDELQRGVTMRLAQETIAGILHPATRQLGLDREMKTA